MTSRQLAPYLRSSVVGTIVCVIAYLVLREIGSGVIFEFENVRGQLFALRVQDAQPVVGYIAIGMFLLTVLILAIFLTKQERESQDHSHVS